MAARQPYPEFERAETPTPLVQDIGRFYARWSLLGGRTRAVLSVAEKGKVAEATRLGSEEDRILRAAFGRYDGRPGARKAAVPVVRHYQQQGAGCWFLCDCRPDAERPPALVPVAQTHIRRHEDDRWPVHCEGCDFHREPAEQRVITASYAAAVAARPMRLVRALAAAPEAMTGEVRRSSQDSKRPGVARLLARLVTEAGLQQLGADGMPLPLIDQVKAIWTVAKGIEVDVGVRLTEFLCTSPAKLGGLMERIAMARPGRFKHSRPHGVLIVRVASVGGGVLVPLAGAPIPVRGRLAVFGEWAGAKAEVREDRAARAPYLAACVLGQASPAEPVEVLSAYVHPCAAEAHLMLVDSDYERQTLAQLRNLQAWLGRRDGTQMTIEKPLFDVWLESPGDADAAPRPPCIPDFVVRAQAAGGRTRVAIAETMGFGDEQYRARKQRVHALMYAALGGATVVLHDFHQPSGSAQRLRDDRFWKDMRWRLTGP